MGKLLQPLGDAKSVSMFVYIINVSEDVLFLHLRSCEAYVRNMKHFCKYLESRI